MPPRSLLVAVAFVLGCPSEDGAGGSTATIGSLATTFDTNATIGSDTTSDSDIGESTAMSADGTESSGEVTTTTPSDESSSSSGGALVCDPPPACDAPTPAPGPLLDWDHTESTFVTNAGGPRHRGRDMFYLPDDDQWVLAKFAYAANDWDLSGERVDLYLLRDCTGDWEPLGSATTTFDDEHFEVEGVPDSGGWVYYQIPEALQLGVGRHRIWAVVRGDGTSTDVYLDVVEPGTKLFVTDVDGTLTTTETEEFDALLSGTLPEAHLLAPEALWALFDKGYHPFYLTARPEWLGDRTRAFIEQRGFPPGLYHTTLSFDGALGSAATDFKSGELDALADRMLDPVWVFGNTSSDGDAYEHANVQPLDHRIFFQYDDTHGGRRIDDYNQLLGEFMALDAVCE